MKNTSRTIVVGALLMAMAGARAQSTEPVVQAAQREVLKTTVPAPHVEEKVRSLEQKVDELEAEVGRLKASEAARPALRDVGDINDHPLWP